MRRLFKVIAITVVAIVLLMAATVALFYFPPFQNWAVKKAAAYASEKTGMEVSVGHVSLAFPLDLQLDSVRVDSLASLASLRLDVQLLPLLKSQVMVDGMDANDLTLNTSTLIDNVRISGKVGKLSLKAHGIDIGREVVRVDDAALADANLLVELSDTVPPDTTPSESHWLVNLARLKVDRTRFALHTPGDTMSVNAFLGDVLAVNTSLDLGKGAYTIGSLKWSEGELAYDQTYQPHASGFDPNHLSLSRLNLSVDSFSFASPNLALLIRSASFRERCGLEARNLEGAFLMDSTSLSLPALALKTPSSSLKLKLRMDLNAFDDVSPGSFTADVHGFLGKQDIMTFASAAMPRGMALLWPSLPLQVDGTLGGNLRKMHLRNVSLRLPTAFAVTAGGFVGNLDNTNRLQANVNVKATTYDLSFLTRTVLASAGGTLRIPYGIGFRGNIRANGTHYATTFTATQGGGSLSGHASIVLPRASSGAMSYDANLAAVRLPLQNFLPGMGLQPFTGNLKAKGTGTDFLSTGTTLEAKADVRSFAFQGKRLDGITADANMRGGQVAASVVSHSALLDGNIRLDAFIADRQARGTLAMDLAHADLQRLGLTDSTLSVGVCGQIDFASDFKDFYRAQGQMSDIVFRDIDTEYHPEDISLDILTRRDTTHAVVTSGDLQLDMDAGDGYKRLLTQLQNVMAAMQGQWRDRHLDISAVRAMLPTCRIYLAAGGGNIISRALKHGGIAFRDIFMDMTASPQSGVNGRLSLDSLMAQGVLLDTIRLNVTSDDSTTVYAAQVRNAPGNPTYVFNALLDGSFNEYGTQVKARVYDDKDSLGVAIGLQASMHPHGISLHVFGDDPILGYKAFAVNDSNYIYLGDDRRVRADMKLVASDGTGVQIYTDDENTAALQDLTVNLHHFDLGKLLSVLPFTPDIAGIFNGDFHIVQEPDELTVSSSVDVENMTYQDCPMGNLGAEFTYVPKSDGSHHVDGMLTQDGVEIATLTGTYRGAGTGDGQGEGIDATLRLDRMPMDLANGFIPDKLFGFRGYGEGSIDIKGTLSKPQVNGEVFLDSVYMFSEPYGVEVRFANDPVAITNSRLLFENFEVFAGNDSPLDIKGYLDFSNLDRMSLNVLMKAENYLLVDAKETSRSEAYGKAYINFYGAAAGLLDNLKFRGRVDVLGSTDLCYVLKDSPLSTDNQLEGLVEFVDFRDTAQAVVSRTPMTGLDMDLTLHIDDGAHIDCFLNADHSNYVDVMGGGDMRMQYNAADGIVLRGRYTIGSGEMKYSLPVIPLKTFTISEGSFIEFTGDPMNPRLSLTAQETTKAAVGTDDGSGRMVEFRCGVAVSKTLQDMGLEFTIDAPEDMTIHNQLQSMSVEERGKLAVTMLTTGMYLADGNTSSFSMNSALSAFLNSQINQISGKALRTLDIGFGVDNSFTETGLQTDYSFKFAKRFWNNRLKVSIGGKLSTGAQDAAEQNETFFDNVSLEYRLSTVSNKYLNLFYERDSYDWLEGNVSKFGGGFTWRRKLARLGDLFRFKDSDDQALPKEEERDSLKQTK